MFFHSALCFLRITYRSAPSPRTVSSSFSVSVVSRVFSSLSRLLEAYVCRVRLTDWLTEQRARDCRVRTSNSSAPNLAEHGRTLPNVASTYYPARSSRNSRHPLHTTISTYEIYSLERYYLWKHPLSSEVDILSYPSRRPTANFNAKISRNLQVRYSHLAHSSRFHESLSFRTTRALYDNYSRRRRGYYYRRFSLHDTRNVSPVTFSMTVPNERRGTSSFKPLTRPTKDSCACAAPSSFLLTRHSRNFLTVYNY